MIANKGIINGVHGIPSNATIRSEYVRCGNIDCKKCSPEILNKDVQKQNFHGPYLIAYWKEGKKLRKRYIGIVGTITSIDRVQLRSNSSHHN